MTQDEMIELAKQAGWQYAHGESGFEPLWAFAKLVAEKEREACWDIVGIALLGSDRELTKRIAAAIRARGQA
jgi:hypothetical protein